MNQENFKAVGEIIKNRIDLIKESITPKYQVIILKEIELLANELADYLKRKGSISKTSFGTVREYPPFNREQFLKWCGVK